MFYCHYITLKHAVGGDGDLGGGKTAVKIVKCKQGERDPETDIKRIK